MPRAADPGAGWCRQPVIYQVHPPSFTAPGRPGARASTGTGRGTGANAGSSALRGVAAAAPYLAGLGVDAVWLSPFDPSALADDGPGDGPGDGLGTLADFDVLDAALHAHGIQVLADLAPNAPAFDFELLEADWDAGSFLGAVADRLLAVPRAGLPTWVLSSQDTGPRRARAAALLMLALPGSAFLYQGEELGPGIVGDLATGIRAQEHDPASMLNLYRQALAWRRKLQAGPSLEWMPGTGGQVLHLRRPGGWRSVTNVGPYPVPLPPGTIVAASSPLASVGPDSAMLPADTTAWILTG